MMPIMTPLAPDDRPARPGLPLAEEPWQALWRALWLDLPLAWAGEIDRFLFRPMEPMAGGIPPASSAQDDNGSDAAALPPATVVWLGLGCGDWSDEGLG
jgi:hypothetical protein